jgi:four helix bundle protein
VIRSPFIGKLIVYDLNDLVAWKVAMDLANAVYDATQSWPSDERFGLTSQVRRAAVSVASNIAEGKGRNSSGEFVHFLGMAYGSLMEVHTQIILAARRKYLSADSEREVLELVARTGQLINALKKSLKSKAQPTQ